MALRSATQPMSIPAFAVLASSSSISKPQYCRFASNPSAFRVPHNHSLLFAGDSRLKFIRRPKTPNGSSYFRCYASALTPQLKGTLDKVVSSHKVVLFMKGTKDFPMCGFSNTVVQILNSLNVPFEDVNILENELLRQGLKEYSSWPTFPQLYIDGEFFGGCDITVEAFNSGELEETLEKAMCS